MISMNDALTNNCFWLIYDKASSEKNKAYIGFYAEEAEKLGLKMKLLLLEDMDFGVNNGVHYLAHKGEIQQNPLFAIVRVIYPLINKQLEYMGIPVFNNSQISLICNDKARTYQYVSDLGIKTVDTCYCKNYLLETKLNRIKGEAVIKAVDGHGGSQVLLYKEGDDIEAVKNIMGASDVVIQPLTGSRHQDLRVYIIGKTVIAAVLRTAVGGFKANFSLGGDVRLYELNETEKETVNTIINAFDFGMVGIDFIIGDEGELIFNEIEDVVGARMLYKCADINLVKMYLEYILEKVRTI